MEKYSESYLNQKISDIFERKYVFLTGNATTAIYIALRALNIRKGNVILPNTLCPDPANAVLYNCLKPTFCDVNLEDYNINIDNLNKTITKDTRAIIPVHLFGQPSEIDIINEIAEDRDLPIIEDVAQAAGGKYKGKKLGTFGDVSVLSFGGKIINAKEGGAVLTDDAKIAHNIEKEIKKLAPRLENKERIYHIYRRIFYATRDACQRVDKLNFLFFPLPYVFKKMYLHRFDKSNIEKTCFELDHLEKHNKMRRENTKEYRLRLNHRDIIHPQYKFFDYNTIYRYSILLKSKERVTTALRRKGFDASNLYLPLHKLFPFQHNNNTFSNSQFIGDHIINLWVEPKITKDYIERVCETILESLNQNE